MVSAMLLLVSAEAFLSVPSQISPQSILCTTSDLSPSKLRIGTGFSFDDGEQVLVSVQKPLGILLEQDEEEGSPVVVADLDSAGSAAKAGVQQGDILLAVQNASVESQSLEYVMDFLGRAPRVVNLRFLRRQ